MKIILFDDHSWNTLRPLTLTRPVAELRIGILTIREKWEKRLGCEVSYLTQEYLQEKYPLQREEDNLMVNASICPNDGLVKEVKSLQKGEALQKAGLLIAYRTKEICGVSLKEILASGLQEREYDADFIRIEYPYDLFSYNGKELESDFEFLTAGRESAPLDETVKVHGKYPVFLEEGVVVQYATINTNAGPVYIGKDAEVMEGVLIRGPLAMCEHAVLNMGAKVYGATTLGPYCKCGGELNNVVFLGYSNKAHDGFLGNSVIGEWCNLGADTNNSNLKNTYAEVKLWDYETRRFRKTGLQFCGLIMGDHSKTGINTMLNTGTVIGVGANVFGADFPHNYIPSFSWGGASGFIEHPMRQFVVTAEAVMKRRGKVFDEIEHRIIDRIYKDTREE